MGAFDELDKFTTRTAKDDFDKPFHQTAGFIGLIALVVFLVFLGLWMVFAFVLSPQG